MLCLIHNIHTSLNYDISFPTLSNDEVPIAGVVFYEIGSYSIYNKETNITEESKECNLYKVQLRGVIKRGKNAIRQDIYLPSYYKLVRKSSRYSGN